MNQAKNTSKRSSKGRLIFWVLFISACGGGYYYYWQKQPPEQTKRYLRQLEHPNAQVAAAAWIELQHLYFTNWAAFNIVLDAVGNENPISFLMQTESAPLAEQPNRQAFVATLRPIFGKTDRIYCRTVGEALMAIAFNEPQLKSDVPENWKKWWAEHGPEIQSGKYSR